MGDSRGISLDKKWLNWLKSEVTRVLKEKKIKISPPFNFEDYSIKLDVEYSDEVKIKLPTDIEKYITKRKNKVK